MGRIILCFAIVLIMACPGWAEAYQLVSVSAKNDTLRDVVTKLAKDIGAEAVFGNSVNGEVTIELRDVTAKQALQQILALQEKELRFKFLKHPRLRIVVAPPDELARICEIQRNRFRMEYLLEDAPAAIVLEYLKKEYEEVKFTVHPKMNGFYATGSSEDLIQIKRDLQSLDSVPEPPPPPLRESIPPKYSNINKLKGHLSSPRPSLTASTTSPSTSSNLAVLQTMVLPTNELMRESYSHPGETSYRSVQDYPLSTFSIDVDTASYANVRRFLNAGQLPPPTAVRVEEMLNYFSYDYPQPERDVPFSLTTELSDCPWSTNHLLRVGIQGRCPDDKNIPPRNLVFLLDVSGSMSSNNKLPLVKRCLQLLVSTLGEQDRVAIVVYAGREALHLQSTSGDQKELLKKSIESLRAGGSTNGSAGIQLAYKVANENFRKGAINRVILCTDGDVNVGLTGSSLISLIEEKREGGTFLSVLGFGTGNIKDDSMEKLADTGNGNYAYIDSLREGQKVLIREAGSTLETIAKDVKLQIEFNPRKVHSYRLIGYENRRLENEDFSNDKKDAGELGAGHNVTALYELKTVGKPRRSALRYQNTRTTTAKADGREIALIKLRYKPPNENESELLEFPISKNPVGFGNASRDLRFAAAVASFGMLLRDSEHRGGATLAKVKKWARESLGDDRTGDRHEFLELVEQASTLKATTSSID